MGDSILEGLKLHKKKICIFSFENFKCKDELNVTHEELQLLKNLSSHNVESFRKHKMKRMGYMKRMIQMLLDTDKLKKLNVKFRKELKLLLKHEDKRDFLGFQKTYWRIFT